MIFLIYYYLFYCKDYILLFILIEFYSLWIIWILIESKKYNLILYYFILSAISSLLIIISLIFSQLQYNNLILQIIITLAFSMKLGIIPFHIIYILLYSNINYNSLFLLNIAPKIFIILILNKITFLFNKFFLITNIINYLLITFSNIYTNNFKKILILSSFTNLSLIIIYSFYSKLDIYIWFILLLYIINNYPIFTLQNKFFNPINNIFIIFNIFSLIGFPLFAGFIYKFLIIKNTFNLLILSLILINSILSIFYYFKFIKFYNDSYYTNKLVYKQNKIEYSSILLSLVNIFIIFFI